MKNIILCLILISFLYSCSSDKDDAETILHISESELLFMAEESAKIIYVESNELWSISEIPNWMTISPNTSKGNKEIIIKVDKNNKEEERSITLTFSAKDKSLKLTVKQIGKDVTLALSRKEVTSEAEPKHNEKELSFEIVSNEAWKILDIPDWCTLNTSEGDKSSTIIITPIKNYIDAERRSTIKITAGSKTEELTIVQKPLDIELHFSNPNGQTLYGLKLQVNSFYEKGDSHSYIIRSNTKWTVESNSSWVTLNRNIGEDDDILSYSIPDYYGKDERNAEIIISAGSQSLKLIVRQSGIIEVSDTNPYQINQRDNAPRVGDQNNKIQIQYIAPGEEGENKHWTFNNFEIVNSDYTVVVDAAPIVDGNYILGRNSYPIYSVPANSLIVATEHSTMYYHEIKDNKLQRVGHENVAVLLNYNPRMVMETYPTYYNVHHEYDFESSFYRGSTQYVGIGHSETIADGYGTLTLPSGTYSNVLRVKLTNKDKLTYDGITLKNSENEYTIYKWYAKGYRYPLFETHRIVQASNNQEIFACAFYCPPQNQIKQSKIIVDQASIKRQNIIKPTLFETIFPVVRNR